MQTKKIFTFILSLLFCISAFSQVGNFDQLRVKSKLIVGADVITGISNDTTFASADSLTLPTAFAVKKYLQSNAVPEYVKNISQAQINLWTNKQDQLNSSTFGDAIVRANGTTINYDSTKYASQKALEDSSTSLKNRINTIPNFFNANLTADKRRTHDMDYNSLFIRRTDTVGIVTDLVDSTHFGGVTYIISGKLVLPTSDNIISFRPNWLVHWPGNPATALGGALVLFSDTTYGHANGWSSNYSDNLDGYDANSIDGSGMLRGGRTLVVERRTSYDTIFLRVKNPSAISGNSDSVYMVPIFNGRPKYDAYLYDSETGFKSLIHPTGDTFSFSLNLAPLAYTDRFKIVFDKTQQIRRGYSTIVMSPDSVSMAPRNIAFMDNDTLKIAPAFTKTTADGLYEPKFSKGTAFNKNFGRSTGTVVDGQEFLDSLAATNARVPASWFSAYRTGIRYTGDSVTIGNVEPLGRLTVDGKVNSTAVTMGQWTIAPASSVSHYLNITDATNGTKVTFNPEGISFGSAGRIQFGTSGAYTDVQFWRPSAGVVSLVGSALTSGGALLIGTNTSDGSNALQVDGGARITSLAGTGNRMVTTDANGVVGAQSLPNIAAKADTASLNNYVKKTDTLQRFQVPYQPVYTQYPSVPINDSTIGLSTGWTDSIKNLLDNIRIDVAKFSISAGQNANANNTTGTDNVVFGPYAARVNKAGSGLTITGSDALYNSDSASNITAVGSAAGYYNTYGEGNISLGRQSGVGFYEDVANQKTFGASNITGTNITITGHNFAPVGKKIPVTYKQGTEAIGGLSNNGIYIATVVDANTLSISGVSKGASVATGAILIPHPQFNNTVSVGNNSYPDKDNQTVVGNTASAETKIFGDIVLPKFTGAGKYNIAVDSAGKVYKVSKVIDMMARNFASDTLAFQGGVAVGEMYRNGTNVKFLDKVPGLSQTDFSLAIAAGSGYSDTVSISLNGWNSVSDTFTIIANWGDGTSTTYPSAYQQKVAHKYSTAGFYTPSFYVTRYGVVRELIVNKAIDSLKVIAVANVKKFTVLDLFRSTFTKSQQWLDTIQLPSALKKLNILESDLVTFNPTTLPTLTQISLDGNNLSEFAPAALPTSTITTIILTAMIPKWSVAQVNAALVYLDSKLPTVASGTINVRQYSGRTPTGDGLTAKNNMISRGWTVNTD